MNVPDKQRVVSTARDVFERHPTTTQCRSELMTVPAQDLGIVILTNAGDGKTRNDVMRMFREEIRARLQR